MRIAFLADSETANGFYRGIGPMTALAHLGHNVRQLSDDPDREPTNAEVRDIDILHIHRFTGDRAQRLVNVAKESGAAIVWDDDDDIGSVEKGMPAYRIFGGVRWEQRLGEMKRIFRVADLVTAPNPTLAERLRGAGAAHTAVIENHIAEQCLQEGMSHRQREGIGVGWIAGLEHSLDVERLPIRETLQRLLDERPDFRVASFGLALGLNGDRYRSLKGLPLLELPRLAAEEFDIGIAPLADIQLNRARSNVKLKEYAAAGLPWLASPIGPYAGLGEKQGGRLVADDRWYDELTRLLDNARERKKLAKRAAKWAASEVLLKHAHKWETRLTEALERARAA